jgi:hypothetical protein
MPGLPTDLCLIADAEAWLGIPTPSGPAAIVLNRLISAASALVTNYISGADGPPGEGLAAMAYNEVRDGNGRMDFDFANVPVFAVFGVTVDTQVLSLATDALASGYTFDEDTISLRGWPTGVNSRGWGFGCGLFSEGRQNVLLQYAAGYTLPNQASPSDWTASKIYPFASTIQPLSGNAGNFIYVCNKAGSSSSSVPIWPQTGCATVQDGTATWINLGVTAMPVGLPADITQATVELVSLRFKERTRIGMVSEHINGQTVTYWMRSGLTPSITQALDPYRTVVPVY